MLLGAENWAFECGYCSTKVGSCGGCCLYYVEDVNVETLYCCEWYLQVWSFFGEFENNRGWNWNCICFKWKLVLEAKGSAFVDVYVYI